MFTGDLIEGKFSFSNALEFLGWYRSRNLPTLKLPYLCCFACRLSKFGYWAFLGLDESLLIDYCSEYFYLIFLPRIFCKSCRSIFLRYSISIYCWPPKPPTPTSDAYIYLIWLVLNWWFSSSIWMGALESTCCSTPDLFRTATLLGTLLKVVHSGRPAFRLFGTPVPLF